MVAAVVFSAFALVPCAPARAAASLEDGVYEVDATVYQATSDAKSMADGAFVKPVQLVVRGGSAQLVVGLQPVSAGSMRGYLGWLKYWPDYHAGKTPPPASELPRKARVESAYDVTDAYNASGSSDAQVRAEKYPKTVSMDIDPGYDELWVQAYIPLMEAIAAGSGTQSMRVHLDYSAATRTGDAPDEGESGGAGEQARPYYDQLEQAIVLADGKLAQTSTYTKASLAALKSARDAAQRMYESGEADEQAVFQQTMSVMQAIITLEAKQGSGAGSKATKKTKKLKMGSLEAGTYTITGKMVKVDKETASMSDAGINHKIKLTVKGSSYKLTVGMKSVAVNGKFSYLGKMKYFKSGYKATQSGPTGSTGATKVLSFQRYDGKVIRDEYGTNYPAQVEIPLISEAKKDGYVPVEVYVPVMEAVAAGQGTQKAYLKLDLDSIKAGASKGVGTGKSKAAKTQQSSAKSPSGDKGSMLSESTLGDDETSSLDGDTEDGALGLAQDLGSDDDFGAGLDPEDTLLGAGEPGTSDPKITKVAIVDDADVPPLKGHVGALLGVPAAIVAAALVVSGVRRRNRLVG